jgi:hypothetical protein
MPLLSIILSVETLNSLECTALTFFIAYSSFNGYLSLHIMSLTYILLYFAQTTSWFFAWITPPNAEVQLPAPELGRAEADYAHPKTWTSTRVGLGGSTATLC